MLETNHACAREVPFEPENMAYFSASPSVDRLIVIPYATDIAARSGNQTKPQVLCDIDVLVLVDQDVVELVPISLRDIGVPPEHLDHQHDEVTEIGRVEASEAFYVFRVDCLALATRQLLCFALGNLRGLECTVLPAVDPASQCPRRPDLLVDIEIPKNLAQQPVGIVAVQNREARLQTREFGMPTEDSRRKGVERSHPFRTQRFIPVKLRGNSIPHLAGSLVGERNCQYSPRLYASTPKQTGETGSQGAGLPGSCSCQNQQGAIAMRNNCTLLRVEARPMARAFIVALHVDGAPSCGNGNSEPPLRSGGDDRIRTGVHGFAVRCVATPPRRRFVGSMPRGTGSGNRETRTRSS